MSPDEAPNPNADTASSGEVVATPGEPAGHVQAGTRDRLLASLNGQAKAVGRVRQALSFVTLTVDKLNEARDRSRLDRMRSHCVKWADELLAVAGDRAPEMFAEEYLHGRVYGREIYSEADKSKRRRGLLRIASDNGLSPRDQLRQIFAKIQAYGDSSFLTERRIRAIEAEWRRRLL
ncbi:hypothetical protein [Nocardia gamkensis]|uniref:Uncharacterized protein n=1 Tax=Nocardia gamkensis TaxID=352869 RepID=A0A7X6L4N9_9NOCA|nr:hypothetical protein [Nocardia gamkensis]NKY27786.1 hypothetical protein [Nocardia gamkensis]